MELFRDARNVTLSVLVATVLIALRSVLILEIVGPTTIGVWKSVMVLLFLSSFARLGLPHAVALRVPVLRGQGQIAEAERAARMAGSVLAVGGLILGLAALGASFLVADGQYRIALRLVASVVWLAQFQEFLREVAGARHMFRVRSVEVLLDSVTNFTATILLAYWFGLVGLGVAAILTALIPVCYLWRKLQFGLSRRVEPGVIRGLVRTGLPFSFLESSFHLTKYLGLPIVAVVLGPTAAGYYALCTLILEFGTNVIQIGISRVVGPHLLREFGRQGNHVKVAKYYETPSRLFCYTLPPVLYLGSLILPGAVAALLPRYTPGIGAAQIVLWAVFFLSINASVDSFLNAAGKVIDVLKISAALIPAGAACHYLAAKSGLGLPGVALSSVATLAAIVTVKLYLAQRECGRGRAEASVFLGSLYFPLLASVGIGLLVRNLGLAAGLVEPLRTSVEAAIYAVLYAPLFAAYEVHFSLVRTARQAM
jgi:O-antigen/teichoic acid export membrane protein